MSPASRTAQYSDELADIDPERLLVAAHELGHYYVFRHAGITVTEVRVRGRGRNATGYNRFDSAQRWDKNQWRHKLVGGLAGRIAELRWCDQHGVPHPSERTCAGDMEIFRSDRRDARREAGLNVSTTVLRAESRKLVALYWPKIVRSAPRLARRGRL